MDDVENEQIDEWRAKGEEAALKEVEELFQDTCAKEYARLMHKVMSSPVSQYRSL